MNYNEFAEQTQRLCDLYSKTLNETQVDFWYISLKNFTSQEYAKAVGEYARKNKYMPTISDILSEIKSIKNREYKEQDEPRETYPCDKCHGSGLVKYVRDGYDYLCTCNCKNGRSLNYPMLRTWDEIFPHVQNSVQV